MRYRNAAGRVITRSSPDIGLEASKRWTRVEPLNPIPEPERARENETAPDADEEKE